MIRKHTRRAAKAAFAISFGVAIVLGGMTAAASAKPQSKPTIIVGNKNFTEEFILGQLYGQALKAKGFPVKYAGSLGSSELADTAITSGKINLLPEYTGVIVLDIAKEKSPKSAAATYAAAKKFEQTRGLTLLNATPFYDTDTFTVLTSYAKAHGLKTIGDMKKVGSFSYAGYPECQTRITCLLGLKQIYGLKQVKFVPLSSISVYTLLDQGKATGGDGFSTDPQQLSGKYTVLTDTKHIFGFQNVAPIISKKTLAAGGPSLSSVINAVSAKLTLPAMQAMNKAVAIDKKTPAAVAAAFLKANGLG
ncbi:MAG TPA: glycine betaine ABC transporter substrate-binding protein [Gaiellaceae bacterium]|nr:glycine betaine ABC transporter substrate-binding protein [Gaiellaceae bacterium]